MTRYTLYRRDTAPIEDATEHVVSAGGKVIASRPGLALIESTEDVAEHLRTVLKDWQISREVTAKKPQPHPKPSSKKHGGAGSTSAAEGDE